MKNKQIMKKVLCMALSCAMLATTVVGCGKNNSSSKADENRTYISELAKKYADVMKLILQYADQTEAVEVWGLTDNMSYRSYEYPLLFDENAQPKPSFWAVADPESVQ